MSSAVVDSSDEHSSRKRGHALSQRRQNKPLIEKRRRARINDCLLQLKALLMKDLTKQTTRPNKLEKADILEMTVDYIKRIGDNKPACTEKEQSTDNAGGKEGVPFLNGFSRCLEEVDSFLNNQLPLQPDLRHKLLTHCRDQLSTKSVTVEEARASHPFPSSSITSRCPSSPEHEASSTQISPCASHNTRPSSPVDRLPLGNNLSDSASDISTDDEFRLKSSCDVISDDVKPMVSEPTTTMAFVTPFQHSSSSVSCSNPNTHSNTPPQDTNSMRLAGPLKLICGGNVFIVVDKQPSDVKDTSAVTFHHSLPSSLSLPGPVLYNPNVCTTAGFASYVPAVTPINPFPSVGLPLASIPLTIPSVVCSPSFKSSSVEPAQFSVQKSSDSCEALPSQPEPDMLSNSGNDINNNVMDVGHQLQSPVWRPW